MPKSYGWDVVAHKILETAQVLGLLWDQDFGLRLVNIDKLNRDPFPFLDFYLTIHFIVRNSVLVNGVRRREAAEDETIPGPAQR